MGIFDFFSPGPAQDAAAAQAAGLQSGAAQYAALNNQAQGALQNNLGTNAINAITGNYGAGLNALTGNYGTAANALQGTTNAGLNTYNTLLGGGANALTGNYAAGLVPQIQNYGQAQAGTNQLASLLGFGPQGSAGVQSALEATPGYQFQLDQGNQNIMRNQAATGQLASGATNLDLLKYGQGLAGTTYQNAVNNLQPYLGYSQNAASGVQSGFQGLGSGLANLLTTQGAGNLGAQTNLGTNLSNVYTGLGGAQNANLMASGNQQAGIYGNLGTGLANLLNQQGQANYGTQVGIGNANASAALAPYNASANLFGTLLGLAGAGAKGAGQAGVGGNTGSLLGSAGSGLGQFYNGLAGQLGFMAEGGRPKPGGPYIVGEKGPELFVPDRPGTIVPNHVLEAMRSRKYGNGLESMRKAA